MSAYDAANPCEPRCHSYGIGCACSPALKMCEVYDGTLPDPDLAPDAATRHIVAAVNALSVQVSRLCDVAERVFPSAEGGAS